jgi:hypothetical protein
MFRSVALGGVCLAGWVILVASSPVQAGGKKILHPRLHAALYELREARTELKEATHDFGGHREKAVKATEAAARQIELALKGADDNIRPLPTEADVLRKYKLHPHLNHALAVLREARVELKDASHNFGGQREAAIRDVDIAIEQVELCLKNARP